jgi:hypothetical protein
MSAYAIPLLLGVAGGLIASSGAMLPPYNNPRWDSGFQNVGKDDFELERSAQWYDEVEAQWYKAKAEAETPRNRRLDLGAGLIALGAGLTLVFVLGRVRLVRDLAVLQSPTTRVAFIVLATVVWLSFIPAVWVWLLYTLERGDYPWWADTIAIPAFEIAACVIMILPVVLLGVALTLYRARLPVVIWSRPIIGSPYIVCLGLLLAAALALLLLFGALTLNPFAVPSFLFTLYLILSGRAAAVVGRAE